MFERLSKTEKTILQLAFVAAICALALGLLVWLGALNPSTDSRSVTFRVEASGGYAVITLQAGTVVISKPTLVTVPWSKTVQVKSGSEVYLTGSNPTQTGKLTCKITLDKAPWKSATTNAPKDGVACAGIVP